MFKLDLHKDISDDLDKLPDEVYDEVYDMLHNLSKDPYKYTQELEDLYGLNLRGYSKTYVYKHEYKIISRIVDDMVQIVEIVAVDKRENFDVYKKAFDRIKNI